ncbi:MAG: nucleotidyltransferase domain-containing protein, partial [Candidatus Peribacteraceae bacterium]|nr:nucleotidyltransferase domain-containing protein [Candidatus Peribacteraceae bacterium]
MSIKKLPLTKKEQEKYATLVEKEVKRLEKKKDVVSILIGGSFARNELTKGSDIDFILVTKTGDSPIEERKTIEDIPVEWFSISKK